MKQIGARKKYRHTKDVDVRMIITMHIYYFSRGQIAEALNTNYAYVTSVISNQENYIGIETLYA